jgi:hypothetical protein
VGVDLREGPGVSREGVGPARHASRICEALRVGVGVDAKVQGRELTMRLLLFSLSRPTCPPLAGIRLVNTHQDAEPLADERRDPTNHEYSG